MIRIHLENEDLAKLVRACFHEKAELSSAGLRIALGGRELALAGTELSLKTRFECAGTRGSLVCNAATDGADIEAELE